jgi:hypothetical protein
MPAFRFILHIMAVFEDYAWILGGFWSNHPKLWISGLFAPKSLVFLNRKAWSF